MNLNDEKLRAALLEKAAELAFGSNADLARLAFLGDEDPKLIEKLDLSRLSELEKVSNGTVKVKALDRVKLIELLLNATEGAATADSDSTGILAALERASQRMAGGEKAAENEIS